MLYAAIVGAEPPSHPEIQGFAEGFSLPCRNGFKFYTVSSFPPFFITEHCQWQSNCHSQGRQKIFRGCECILHFNVDLSDHRV